MVFHEYNRKASDHLNVSLFLHNEEIVESVEELCSDCAPTCGTWERFGITSDSLIKSYLWFNSFKGRVTGKLRVNVNFDPVMQDLGRRYKVDFFISKGSKPTLLVYNYATNIYEMRGTGHSGIEGHALGKLTDEVLNEFITVGAIASSNDYTHIRFEVKRGEIFDAAKILTDGKLLKLWNRIKYRTKVIADKRHQPNTGSEWFRQE